MASEIKEGKEEDKKIYTCRDLKYNNCSITTSVTAVICSIPIEIKNLKIYPCFSTRVN